LLGVHDHVALLALVVPHRVVMAPLAAVALLVLVASAVATAAAAAATVASAVAAVTLALVTPLLVVPLAPVAAAAAVAPAIPAAAAAAAAHLDAQPAAAKGDAVSVSHGVLGIARVAESHKRCGKEAPRQGARKQTESPMRRLATASRI
jgi:hypothetical protein